MRLSPFPPDADRPWQQVWRYAGHNVWLQLRSPWFWVLQIGLPVMVLLGLLGMSVITASGGRDRVQELLGEAEEATAEPVFTVVAEAPGAREAVAAWLADGPLTHADFGARLADPEQEDTAWVVTLAGTFPRGLEVSFEAPDEAGGQARIDDVRWMVEALRRRTVVADAEVARVYEAPRSAADADAEVAPEDRAATLFRDLGLALRWIVPGLLGFAVALGLASGFTTAARATSRRDDGYVGVLRVGTPAAVLFLGAVLEAQLLALAAGLPYVVLGVPLALILGAAGLAFVGSISLSWLGILPALAVAMPVGWSLGAALGALVSSGRPHESAPGGGSAGGARGLVLPLGIVLAVYGYPMLVETEGVLAGAVMLLPGLGVPRIAAAVLEDGTWAWPAVACLVQAATVPVGLRVGTWAFGLEEGVQDEVTRWWRVRRGVA